MQDIPDQEALWDKKHDHGEHAAHRGHPSHFAQKAIGYFPSNAAILEVGCGVGSDTAFFAEAGYTVQATDISQVVLDQGKEIYNNPNITFQKVDISKPLAYDDGQFNVVYSHLALHYYDDKTTHRVFAELHRVLKPGGVLAFVCKSTDDVDYGKGRELERDFFVSKGHVRHFFSINYARSLLREKYDISVLEDIQEHYSNKTSAFVQCIAIKGA